jgi:hypothetical protein
MFVYLCDGRVIEVAQATSAKVEASSLILYAGKQIVERFSLREVYFTSKVMTSPIPC